MMNVILSDVLFSDILLMLATVPLAYWIDRTWLILTKDQALGDEILHNDNLMWRTFMNPV
jgi:hypothetical protein